MINRFLGLFSRDLGIDLGTANTLVAIAGQGVAIRAPSVLARHKKSKDLIAIGEEADKMIGKTPAHIEVVRPLQSGVIADFDATQAMLAYYINKIHQIPGRLFPKIPRPRVAIGIPSGVTEVERRAVSEAARAAGASQAYLIEEPVAAALGIGLPIQSPTGSLVIDIGGGTTEIAVISLGGIVVNKSLPVAGAEMDKALVHFVRLKYGVLIGEKTAERLKIAIGSLLSDQEPGLNDAAVVRGRDLETGLPKSIKITSREVAEALAPLVNQILAAVREILQDAPPELVADILERGAALAGGSVLLRGLDRLFESRLKLPVWIADDPQSVVVKGAVRALENKKLLAKVQVK